MVDIGQTTMDLKLISEVVSSIGLPGAILIWVIWRLDKFLTKLTEKLEVYNGEFKDIGFALNGIVAELKEIKDRATLTPKK